MPSLLAAISLIDNLPEIPPFQLWIIGGNETDFALIQEAVGYSRSLQKIQKQGRLQCWGKVAYDALPEFYSRSSVLVFPSKFETFGRVAVEAMSCGCPVIAADTTGVKETVLHGLTGLFYDPFDVTALASILADCIIWPRRLDAWAHISYEWTQHAFSLEGEFDAYLKLYQGKNNVSPKNINSYTPLQRYQCAIEETFNDSFSYLINGTVTVSLWWQHPHHLVAEINSGNKQYLAIQYQQLDDAIPAPSPVCEPIKGKRTARQRINKVEQLLPYFPTAELVGVSKQDGCMLFHKSGIEIDGQREKQFFVKASKELIPPKAVEEFNQVLNQLLESPSRKTLDACDWSGCALDAWLENDKNFFRMRHPQVELYRIQCHLEDRKCLLDPGFIKLSQWLLELVSPAPPLVNYPVRLQRYPGCGRHYTGKLPLLMVLDACGFAFGPLDLAFDKVWRLEHGREPDNILSLSSEATLNEEIIGNLWLVVLLIYRGLMDSAEGRMSENLKRNDMLEQFIYLFVTKKLVIC